MIEAQEIMEILPHKHPFLLIDRIIEFEKGKRIVGIKNVTVNEPFFGGHFPGYPIMPGVLVIEAMAQVGGVLVFKSDPGDIENKTVFFMGIDKAKFRRPVIPGDQMKFELEVTKRRGSIWGFKGTAYVDEKLVAEAELLATIADKKPIGEYL